MADKRRVKLRSVSPDRLYDLYIQAQKARLRQLEAAEGDDAGANTESHRLRGQGRKVLPGL